MLMRKDLFTVAAASIVSIVGIASAGAAPATFTIDPAQSQMTASGRVVGMALTEQGAGSLTTRFGGAIQADVAASSITFTSGSTIDAMTNGVWAPGVEGAAGTAPADLGARASSFLGTVLGAVRNLIVDVTSGSLTLTNGAFNATGLVFSFPTNSPSTLDYSSPIGDSTMSLRGLSANNIAQTAMLSVSNGIPTLTIQVDAEYRFRLLSEGDSNLRLVGQIVAKQQQSGPQIVSSRLSNGTFIIEASGVSATAQVQSSTNLSSWNARTSTKSTIGNGTTFTIEQLGSAEFFRIVE